LLRASYEEVFVLEVVGLAVERKGVRMSFGTTTAVEAADLDLGIMGGGRWSVRLGEEDDASFRASCCLYQRVYG